MTGSTKAYKASKHKVADIINQQWSQIQSDTHFNSYQIRILDAIRKCRTPALGGYLYQCSHCGHVHKRYNSCRNRHCPTCQNTQKEKWILARQASLINTRYYHAVFTIPAELNQFCLAYPRQMYSILFQCAWQTLDSFAWNPKYLGAQIGVTMVLHTWGQNLSLHPHVHCIVPGGGLTAKNKWKDAQGNGKFLFPVKAMSILFRGKFMAQFKANMDLQGLVIPPEFISKLYRLKWVVFTKSSFAGPKGVIEYLARYSHKAAISNYRIKAISSDKIIFQYKDYKHGGRSKSMALHPQEFVRRFSLHLLPRGFTKIRHYGILSSKYKAIVFPESKNASILKLDWEVLWQQKGLDVTLCPNCKKPTLKLMGEIPKRGPPQLINPRHPLFII